MWLLRKNELPLVCRLCALGFRQWTSVVETFGQPLDWLDRHFARRLPSTTPHTLRTRVALAAPLKLESRSLSTSSHRMAPTPVPWGKVLACAGVQFVNSYCIFGAFGWFGALRGRSSSSSLASSTPFPRLVRITPACAPSDDAVRPVPRARLLPGLLS